ncbi:hypothetical protein DFH09DRAFT_869997, partial [Mycena vulgaris]
LSINLAIMFPDNEGEGTDFSHPLFTHITHLDLDRWYESSWPAWAGLAQSPRLAYLTFHHNLVPASICQDALAHCTSLQVLAIVSPDQHALRRYFPEFAEVAADLRFVMVVVAEKLEDWEMGARGGEDYWVVAECLVQKRRSGEIKGRRLSQVHIHPELRVI